MKPIRADIAIRIHGGEIVASVSDGEEVSVHREGDERTSTPVPPISPEEHKPPQSPDSPQ